MPDKVRIARLGGLMKEAETLQRKLMHDPTIDLLTKITSEFGFAETYRKGSTRGQHSVIDTDRAIEIYNNILNLDSDEEKIILLQHKSRLGLVEIYIGNNEYGVAIKLLSEVMDSDSESVDHDMIDVKVYAGNKIVKIYEGQNDFGSLFKIYEKTLDLKPNDLNTIYHGLCLVDSLTRRRCYDEAMIMYYKMIDIDIDDDSDQSYNQLHKVSSGYELGFCLYENNSVDKAHEIFDLALNIKLDITSTNDQIIDKLNRIKEYQDSMKDASAIQSTINKRFLTKLSYEKDYFM